MAAGKRGSMEFFRNYRDRLQREAETEKAFLRGRLIWSAQKGTAVKDRKTGEYFAAR